jgi:branched-chain amino acid aminotransferase
MSQNLPEYIHMNGQLVRWQDATVHVMTHALHYGSSVFEGIRAYQTPKGPAIFRYREHMERLYRSARIYDLEIPVDIETFMAAGKEVLRANGLSNAYLRPLAWRGAGGFGLGADNPTGWMVAAWVWGPYLGAQALSEGIDACISSWRRVAPATIPATAKAGGNYLSSILVSREAKRLGFAEGIALTVDGYLAEGAGENLFLIEGKTLYTPPVSASILHGITRATAMTIAQDLGYTIVEQNLPREMIYLVDEVFMTGTAAEITPIRSVDGKKIGTGKPGPVTKAIQQRFFGLFDGSVEDTRGWLDYF